MKGKEQNNNKLSGKKITRKEAIKKAGITALTATSLLFLETKAHAAQSGDSPTWPGGGRG